MHLDRHNVPVLSYSVLPAVSYHVIDSALYCIMDTSWKVFLHCVQPITYTHVISYSSINSSADLAALLKHNACMYLYSIAAIDSMEFDSTCVHIVC